jgi:hypothetical protein
MSTTVKDEHVPIWLLNDNGSVPYGSLPDPVQQTVTRMMVEMLVEYARLQNPQGQCAPLPTTDCFLDFEKWPNEAILA